MLRLQIQDDTARRRAVTAILVVVSMPVLIGFAALTIDVGMIYSVRTDLQIASDAAAMAGADALRSDAMTQMRLGADSSGLASVRYAALGAIDIVSGLNQSFGVASTVIEAADVRLGWIDLTSGTSAFQTTVAASTFNAIEVIVRRGVNSVNGPVQLLFSPLFGKQFSDVSASAVAAFDDRFSGYDTGAGGAATLPISMDIADYNSSVMSGTDDYGLDGSGGVTSGADGNREVIAFPNSQAAGNFGLLNIGLPNQGVPGLRTQIEDGVLPSEFETEIGTSELTFALDDGTPTSYTISGNPGMKASLETSFQTLVGKVVTFFIHDSVTGTGANAQYNIIGLRFGIVMNVKLKGNPSSRGLWIQPVNYGGVGVLTNVNVASSGGIAGRLILAR